MANENNQNKNQLQIQLKPEVADGKYSNLAMIGHGPNEFLIDFIFAAPGMHQSTYPSTFLVPISSLGLYTNRKTMRKHLSRLQSHGSVQSVHRYKASCLWIKFNSNLILG